MINTKYQLNIRKGSTLMKAWAYCHDTALSIARAYTDRGHEVALVSYPDLHHVEITSAGVDSMLGLNA